MNMYTHEKNGKDDDIVVSGFETGIAPSPHKGIANIQNANISTETGEVLASFGRIQNTMTNTAATGTLTFLDSSHVTLSIPGSNADFKGMWITVSSSSHTGELANGTYYVQNIVTGANSWTLASAYPGTTITGYSAGLTATITLFREVGSAIQYASELYYSGPNPFNRYYVLDSQGLVWVYDTVNDLFPTDDTSHWFLPDTSMTYWGSDAAPSGLLVLNSTLMVFSGNKIWVKQTVNLGSSYVQMTNAILMSVATSSNPHFGFTGHQGRGYYTDGPFVGSIFPNTSLLSGEANIQSVAAYTAVTTTATLSQLISGTIPSVGPNVGETGFSRIPAVFFPTTGGTLPSAITANTIYYIEYSTPNGTFQVFSTLTGGSAINMSSGAVGAQYYNTFWVIGTHAGAYGDTATMVFSPERLALPIFEISKCLCEVSNTLLIGARGSVVYPWNQVDATPGGLINLPEGDVQQLLVVNQMSYIFAGYKGNVYITDGSVASLVIKVPDYCAGVPGTPSSYIEPKFVWGGTMYLRGRVYFSVLDQTSTKAGNCGGIWSFVPTQNLYIGQDTGIAVRQENRSSYATYNGVSTVLIPAVDQTGGLGPQFWSCWQDGISNPNYGFDKTATTPIGPIIIETDALPVGTVLNKYTAKQIEYKLATALISGETVAVNWRKNLTNSWTSSGNVITPDGATSLSGYFTANFQGAQWVQLQFIITPISSSSSSFTRFTEARIR